MKKTILILIFSIALIGGIWAGKEMYNNSENKNKTSENKEQTDLKNTEKLSTTEQTNQTNKETIISEFSTEIHSKDEKRQNNITITCNTINGKEIKPTETFSFCETVGQATTSKGYQKAEIYVEGEKKQGLGGGNCQVSTTIYNAVLQVPELEVIERHKHSNHVTYIEDGKDAAVAYGSYDFKFKNNTKNTIKIIVENTEKKVTVKLLSINN